MMMCCVCVPREGSCRGFSAHPYPRHPKEGGKKVTVCFPPPPTQSKNGPHLLRGTCMAGCLHRRRGPHNHPQRSRQDQLQSASGSTWLCLSPILSGTSCGLSVAQWCCCYKYVSTSVSKWQLYSGPRTHCLGTVRASHTKKGEPSVGALVDMYLCTCSGWCVPYAARIAAFRLRLRSQNAASNVVYARRIHIIIEDFSVSGGVWFGFSWKSKELLLQN